MSSLLSLNDHLFAQLDRLSNGDLTSEQIEQEVSRADAIVSISDQVLSSANTQLKAAKLFADHGQAVLPHLPQIAKAKE